jgi:uncharacterized repeat protein (TIGR02543 family)
MKKLVFALVILAFLVACSNIPENTIDSKYKIIYEGNGNTYGFPPVDNNEYISGSYVTIPDKNTLEKTGYDFDGWNTKSDYSGILYNVGSNIEIKNTNIFLYAVWNEIIKLSVSFNSGGSNINQIKDIIYGTKY